MTSADKYAYSRDMKLHYPLRKALKVLLIPVVLAHSALSTIPANWSTDWYFRDFWK